MGEGKKMYVLLKAHEWICGEGGKGAGEEEFYGSCLTSCNV